MPGDSPRQSRGPIAGRLGRGRGLVPSLPLAILLASSLPGWAGDGAAASAPTLPPSPAAVAAPQQLPPLTDAEFARLLAGDDAAQLDQLCRRTLADPAQRSDRLRQLRERLLGLHPAPQPLEVVLSDAGLLLRCQAPQAALTVLDRFGPAPGPGRQQWLVLQWRAATASLDHRRAALALERLTASRPANLEALALPVREREDGSVVSRSALDLLAGHLEARGYRRAAAELLIASGGNGLPRAERLQQAARLLSELPPQEREALLEAALEQAAAAGAWGLVGELLDAQVALSGLRGQERRLRLSPRLDDAYAEWRLRREDPAEAARTRELEQRLRSPLDPGGHAAGPSPTPPVPTPDPLQP